MSTDADGLVRRILHLRFCRPSVYACNYLTKHVSLTARYVFSHSMRLQHILTKFIVTIVYLAFWSQYQRFTTSFGQKNK